MCVKENRNYLLFSHALVFVCLPPRSNTSLRGSPAGCGSTGKASVVGSAWLEAAGWGQGSASGLGFGIGSYHTFLF